MSTSPSPVPAENVRFDPPGPGHWEIDRTHFSGGTTPISAWLMEETVSAGMGRVFAELNRSVPKMKTTIIMTATAHQRLIKDAAVKGINSLEKTTGQ